MNEDHIAALDQSIGHDVSCWLATLPVPTSYGEYNLFAREPVLFRKKKGKVGGNEDAGYSRQQTRGIQIPTSSPAVVHEWTNVRQLLQLWAWEVSPSILILKARTSMPRNLLTNKTDFKLPLTLPASLLVSIIVVAYYKPTHAYAYNYYP
jgi:hypothetical protein